MTDAVLTLNAGSSSIKFALYEIKDARQMQRVLSGVVEEIDSAPVFSAFDPKGTLIEEKHFSHAKDFDELLELILDWIDAHLGDDTLVAVGHRVVHGGANHHQPERVTSALLDVLEKLSPLAPLHQPHNLAPIRAIARVRPALVQVACFDTAFHYTMPTVATRFALPRDYEREGVRRYGFHGLSYEFIANRLKETEPELAQKRLIVAHLGNGASLCAMHRGVSVDTTMGFTALDGLMMGTRCGSIDPGVVLYMQQAMGLGVKDVEQVLYKRSGLLGVSGGLASDMRTLLHSGDPNAAQAIELFVFLIVREVGALASSLGGLDGLVFTAGIGEHAPEVRHAVCARLAWLGVEFDAAANAVNAPIVSSGRSQIEVRVMHTDEEAMIARHTLDVILDPTD